ncbi:type VI secretion protein IcmF/TssM N-terminal domain-containing protein [Pseudoduganella sp. R-32]|uniref:type VI secretion protein IcmF/TssM N-terminal domain-containing protein n=1 Tax=Pseudoduganella sp. R-32 TaxID=3404061 RepID=UPI003CF2103D
MAGARGAGGAGHGVVGRSAGKGAAMLNFLSDNLAIVSLLLVTLLVLALLAVVVSAALRAPGQDAGAAAPAPKLASDSLRQSFRTALELIEANLATRAERYKLCWTLVLDEGSGAGLPLAQSGLPSALSVDSSQSAAALGVGWHFFDQGVVVQLQASQLGSPDPDSAANTGIWDDFIALCRKYRPQRPFDAIVLALPCAALLASDAQGQQELAARAKAIHRRLWLAQNRLALRFPLHIVITECEQVPGFASFAAALPEALRRSMVGWAAPYEVVAPFREAWVDAAMDQVTGSVADACAELCALEGSDGGSSAYFLLPAQLERLRSGLKLFCGELMRPSAYHEPFLLRGIYLSGDCSAALPAGQAEPAVQQGAAPAGHGMPAFLRDIFERKIFAEMGLLRGASRPRRPALSHAGRLALWAVPAMWGVGLVVATVQLAQQGGAAHDYLLRQSLADSAADAASPQAGQQRTVDALRSLEQLGARRFSSVFMPGSWALFDKLHGRLQQRLAQDFAQHAFEPLRRAALAQASALTGVPRDPAGQLIPGAQCSLPARWSEAAGSARALNLEDLPQYLGMLQYLDQLDRLDGALQALRRLQDPGAAPATGDDLALAVRVLLGVQLQGLPPRTAAMFRATAQQLPALDLAPMQQAARCTLQLASHALYRRLFDGNGLLRAEQAVAASTAGLLDTAPRSPELAGQLQLWTALRGALDDEKAMLATAKGGWMREGTVNLGATHEALLARIAANGLLGPALARDSKERAAQGFTRFKAAWDGLLATPLAIDGGSTGLAWTEGHWAFTPERKLLHETVTALLAQPYMKEGAPARLPDVPPGATLAWDKGQLERAASMAEARKAFQAGSYLHLPAPLQPPAAALVDLALADSTHHALAQAASIAPAALPSAASDAERAAALRVRAFLEELGARPALAELDAALARDALTRLQRMDDYFTAAEVFQPRERNFQSWKGGRGALADAFAGGDAGALPDYVAQQLEFIEVAGKQVEGVLPLAGATAAGAPAVARWQGIAADLRRYRLKSPTSSLIALEQFILLGASEIDAGNCQDKLAGRGTPRRGADLFAERLASLQDSLLARCRELSANQYRAEWERFAEGYNRDLGRRLPFVAWPGSGGDTAAAAVDEVGAALRQYERVRAAAARAEREPGRPVASAAVRQADLQWRRVRDVLAPLFPAEEGQAGGLDVTAQFRVNVAAEAEANKIIEWSLAIGASTVRQGETPRALRWEPGMPVLLSLRFARDGMVQPKAEGGHPNMTVEACTVSYRFDDPWALFSFIGAYRDADTSAGDGRVPLLRFEFPLAHSEPAAPDTRARVFVRLLVSAPGKRAPLAWPLAWPTHAPAWEDPARTTEPARRTAQAALGE